MLQEQSDLQEKPPTKGKAKLPKEPSKVFSQLATIGKAVGTTMLTSFLAGIATAAGYSAWAAVSQRRQGGDVLPLRKVG